MLINTKKTGSAKVLKDTRQAKEAQKAKVELGKYGSADITPLLHKYKAKETPTVACEEEDDTLETDYLAVSISFGETPKMSALQ